ncbi:MAG: SH3 domain-containing protein [Nitrospirales bacterium]
MEEASATIFSGAGPKTSVIASISKDQTLAINGELGDWYRVKLSEKETGWIAKNQVVVSTLALKGEMPLPHIQGLETSKTAQLITLSEKLEEAEIARAKIKEDLDQREREVEELRTKVADLTATHVAKQSHRQEESVRERREREQAAQALKEQEQEMEHLRSELNTMAKAQTTEMSTMQEKLQREYWLQVYENGL